jgi:hypothetical protein
VLRDDFGPESDVDVLVEFDAGRTPGFFRLFDMQAELATILGGRRVELMTPGISAPTSASKSCETRGPCTTRHDDRVENSMVGRSSDTFPDGNLSPRCLARIVAS